MKQATIHKQITIHAPAAHVWQWVGSEAGLRQWWQRDLTLEAKAGGRCSERGLLNGIPYQLDGIVTLYDPPRQLALLLRGEQIDREQSDREQSAAACPVTMQITITLEEAAGSTVVRVMHQVSVVEPVVAQQPVLVVPAPVWQQLPPILNQLPVQPLPVQRMKGSMTTGSIAAPSWANDGWRDRYETQWLVRLMSLLQLTKTELK